MSHILTEIYILIIAEIYGYYECNDALMSQAKVTATSYLSNRGPENAVLYGKCLKNFFFKYLWKIIT